VKVVRKFERFMEANPAVEKWLKNRPWETQRQFARCLEKFCKAMGVEPEQWRSMDKFEARDIAWRYISKVAETHPGTAQAVLTALKSWYRNRRGEQLPLDSGRGGKHHLPKRHPKRSFEHIPPKNEMYQIIDMASSLRDKAILLFLFQSGVRVNVLEHITYGDVKDQLGEDMVRLKITPRLDYKLRSLDIPYYYTFLASEGTSTLKRYCEVHHKNSASDTPLFSTRSGKAVKKLWVWKLTKNAVRKAGFDPKTVWTHTIRKAFRKVVRRAPIDDDDDKEQLMGHKIPGSREAYFDRKDIDLIKEAYLRCDFTREIPRSNHVRMKTKMSELEAQNLSFAGMIEELRRELAAMKTELKALKKS